DDAIAGATRELYAMANAKLSSCKKSWQKDLSGRVANAHRMTLAGEWTASARIREPNRPIANAYRLRRRSAAGPRNPYRMGGAVPRAPQRREILTAILTKPACLCTRAVRTPLAMIGRRQTLHVRTHSARRVDRGVVPRRADAHNLAALHRASAGSVRIAGAA